MIKNKVVLTRIVAVAAADVAADAAVAVTVVVAP